MISYSSSSVALTGRCLMTHKGCCSGGWNAEKTLPLSPPSLAINGSSHDNIVHAGRYCGIKARRAILQYKAGGRLDAHSTGCLQEHIRERFPVSDLLTGHYDREKVL